jgi:hypothetical protein
MLFGITMSVDVEMPQAGETRILPVHAGLHAIGESMKLPWRQRPELVRRQAAVDDSEGPLLEIPLLALYDWAFVGSAAACFSLL